MSSKIGVLFKLLSCICTNASLVYITCGRCGLQLQQLENLCLLSTSVAYDTVATKKEANAKRFEDDCDLLHSANFLSLFSYAFIVCVLRQMSSAL